MFPSKQSPGKIFSEGVLLNGYTSKKNFPYVDSWFLDACQGSCTSTVEPGSQKKSSLFECWNNKYIIRHFQLLFTKHYHFVIYELETIAWIPYCIYFLPYYDLLVRLYFSLKSKKKEAVSNFN